jgi:AcrR family transcriptional regulator
LSPTDLDGLLRTAWALELGVGILEAYEALDVEPAALAHQAERLWSAANHPVDAPSSPSTDPPRSEWIVAPWADPAAEKVDTAGTSARLLSSAAQLFDERGFSAVSVRDLARATGLTTGSIYGNFPNKLAVLVSVIEARIVQDLEQIPADVQADSTPADLVHLHLANMEERSLVLQGATAARSQRDARQRLRETQLRHTRFWADAFEAWAAARSIDFDGRGYVAAVWSAELGQGVLEAVGLTPPPASFMSSLFARVLTGVGLGPDHHGPIGPDSRGASLP